MRHQTWIGACLLATACDGGGGSGGPSYGLELRTLVSGLTFPTGLPDPGPVDAVDAFPLLAFRSPMLLTHAGDGSDRVFVVERDGIVLVFGNDPATAASSVFLDLRAQVRTGGERGMLGLAFDPDYATNGAFYVAYSTTTSTPGMDHRTVVSRFQVSAGDPHAADPGSQTVLLSIDQPFSNHNGGMLAFGPDRNLYVSVGDGGSQDDPGQVAQDTTSLLGKILRLTRDGTVPPDNPLVGAGGGVREEIWAWGFRNPWRFSFDRGSGELWCGDVGQSSREEVDVVVAGGNYGWDVFEGSLDHENPGNVPLSSTVGPLFEYGHGVGRSITGGYVYRGAANPSLVGSYVYGDFVTGRLWALVWDGQQAVSNEQIGSLVNPASFGEDEDGELYVCCFDDRIYRLQETGSGGGAFPQLLSETGLFADTAALEAAPGVVEYDVNHELWSDGARKRRWMALPGTARIGFHPTEAWSFPVGTVLVKHFEVDVPPGQVRRLETRVLLNHVSGWAGYTYRWNAQGTDADLLPGPASEPLTILDANAPGGQVDLTWNYPDRAECLVCHTLVAGRVLGLRTRQLNRDFPYPTLTDNQLRAWNHVRLFTTSLGSAAGYGALPGLDDPLAAVELRARAYLDINCAMCHRPGGPTPVSIDLLYDTPAGSMNAIGVAPSAGDVELFNPFLITPFSKQDSVLWERMRLLDGNRMPPLGSGRAHDAGLDAVGQWIDDGAP